jgi:two-component system phosphate regulon sensor histidine kinase PhoR
LQPLEQEEVVLHPPYDIANTIGQTFSRFPYPESFFVWKSGEATLFNRTDRPPQWSTAGTPSDGYPVKILTNSPVAEHLADLARNAVQRRDRFVFFNTTIEQLPYQVVARPYYADKLGSEAVALVGFTVNLDWIKQFYLPELISQVQRVSGPKDAAAISLAILDEAGNNVTGDRTAGGPVRERQFPLAFFNSAAVPQTRLQQLPLRQWTVRINTAGDSLLAAANFSARITRGLILFATLISIGGILFAAYLLHSHLQLEAMKAEFVNRVSHELKTPLASISLVGDTLLQGRYNSEKSVKEYGTVLSKEASRLNKLVENLLTFSRIAGPNNAYSMAEMHIEEVVDEALERLRPQIGEKQFGVRFEGPDRVVKVHCDREALIQAFENVIENAIRYSGEAREIAILMREGESEVSVSIKDSGKGIAPEDIPHVFDRFYRGKNAAASAGSGLGLSIAQKVITDHGGRISIDSTPGEGTTVRIFLPASIEVIAWKTAAY